MCSIHLGFQLFKEYVMQESVNQQQYSEFLSLSVQLSSTTGHAARAFSKLEGITKTLMYIVRYKFQWSITLRTHQSYPSRSPLH